MWGKAISPNPYRLDNTDRPRKHEAAITMNISALFTRALWLALAVSAVWVIVISISNYNECRAYGLGKIGCFVVTLMVSAFQVIIFVIGTVIKLLLLVLP